MGGETGDASKGREVALGAALVCRCGSAGSGEKFESVDVVGAHDPEVSFIEGRDSSLVQPLSDSDGGRVDDVEAGIGVGSYEFVNSIPVIGGEIHDVDVASQDRADELLLSVRAVAVQQKPPSFSNNWCCRS